MSRPLEQRRAPAGATPAYPAAPAPGEPPKAPMIANRLSRWAPWALLAMGGTALAVRMPRPATAATVERSSASNRDDHRSTPAAWISDLADSIVGAIQGAPPPPPQGEPAAPPIAFLTEAETREILARVLREHGVEAKPVQVRRAGLDFEADALDAGRGVGVEVLGAAERCEFEFRPAESDLSAQEIEELALLRARGELRMLVLDGRAYEYDKHGAYGGRLPTRERVVERLTAELERFLTEAGP